MQSAAYQPARPVKFALKTEFDSRREGLVRVLGSMGMVPCRKKVTGNFAAEVFAPVELLPTGRAGSWNFFMSAVAWEVP
jgi:hypothetical protein